jgi:hypothetical protein
MESLQDVKRQRDFYKSQVDNYEYILDCTKITIYTVIGILLCCIEF